MEIWLANPNPQTERERDMAWSTRIIVRLVYSLWSIKLFKMVIVIKTLQGELELFSSLYLCLQHLPVIIIPYPINQTLRKGQARIRGSKPIVSAS
jgi:hypothetical protein